MSLKEICKKRILKEMIAKTNKHGSKYVVLIVDEETLRVLSANCKVYDILQEGVTVVELITKKRQALPELSAIYFLSANLTSVELLLEDFKDDKKPQYKEVHLFFSSPIGTESGLMETLASSRSLLTRIRACKELNLNFIASEPRVFHFNAPGHLTKLFPVSQPELLHNIADKLLCLCSIFNEKPHIRFQVNRFGICEKLATILNDKLKKLTEPGPTGSSTLLIVDRSIDTASLLLHEYSYQACAYDLLKISCCTNSNQASTVNEQEESKIDDTFEYTATNNLGKKESKRSVLSEVDDLWIRFRHSHIDDVTKAVNAEVQTFINENAAAKLQRNENVTSDQALQAIRGLPQYQEMLAKYSTHVTMTSQCHTGLRKNKILEGLGTLEQDLACGVDIDGSEAQTSKLLSTLGWLLASNELELEVRVRIILLFFTQILGVGENERRKITEAGQLSLDWQKIVLRFLSMELHLGDELARNVPSGRMKRRLEIIDKERLRYNKQKAKKVEKELSRFEPNIKGLIAQLAGKCLSGAMYPYVSDPSVHIPTQTESVPKAMGIGKATQWDFNADDTNDNSRKESARKSIRASETFFVFILGGVTHSETRAVYELNKESKINAYIGGSCILTPHNLIEMLRVASTQ